MKKTLAGWLADSNQQLTVKYIFEHVRNAAITTLLIGSAVFLINNAGELKTIAFISPSFAGWNLICAGFSLLALNILQFFIAFGNSVSSGASMPAIILLSVLVVWWSNFLVMYVVYAQLSDSFL